MRYYTNIDGKKNRFYKLDEQIHRRKVGGEWKYVIDTWRGRIGKEPGTLICFPFASIEKAQLKIIDIQQTRLKHGYQETSGFPEIEVKEKKNKNEQLSFGF